MAITQEVFAILAAPFEAHQHEFKGGYIYIEETAVCERIEMVDLSWSMTQPMFVRSGAENEFASVSATMTILGVTRGAIGSQSFMIPNQWKTESDEAYAARILVEFRKAELEKGGATDWLKRVARLYGIGRYLLQCPDDVKKHGPELNAWLKKVALAQDWTPQFFEARCFRVLGLVREDLIAQSKVVEDWKIMTYPQKFDKLTEIVAARTALPATLPANS